METVNMPVTRYRTHDGKPTCGANFKNNEFCMFLMNRRFGTENTCMFCEEDYRGLSMTLKMSDKEKVGDQLGYLIPCESCPIWKIK